MRVSTLVDVLSDRVPRARYPVNGVPLAAFYTPR